MMCGECWLKYGDPFKDECSCYELEIRQRFKEDLKREGTDSNRQVDWIGVSEVDNDRSGTKGS